MKELLEAIECTDNVKSIEYQTSTGLWTIIYKSNLKPDSVTSDDLIDFLNNA